MLEARDVSVQFGGHQALSRVSIAAPAGQITGLIGPNGAGKTTLFNAISGLVTPTSGTITIDGSEAGPARSGPDVPAARAVHDADRA